MTYFLHYQHTISRCNCSKLVERAIDAYTPVTCCCLVSLYFLSHTARVHADHTHVHMRYSRQNREESTHPCLRDCVPPEDSYSSITSPLPFCRLPFPQEGCLRIQTRRSSPREYMSSFRMNINIIVNNTAVHTVTNKTNLARLTSNSCILLSTFRFVFCEAPFWCLSKAYLKYIGQIFMQNPRRITSST